MKNGTGAGRLAAVVSLIAIAVIGGCATRSGALRGQLVLLDLQTTSVESGLRGDFANEGTFVTDPGAEFRDERLSIRFDYRSTSLGMEIGNPGGKPLQVRWYEVSFIDTDGTPHRVFNGALEQYVAKKTNPPGPIAPGATVETEVSPTDYVFWYGPINRYGEGTWEQHPLLSDRTDGTQEELAARLAEIPTLTIGLFLPVEIEGVVYDYRFTFKPVNVRPGPMLDDPGKERFLGEFGPQM